MKVEKNCTCHPSEAPTPCQRKYAYSECIKAMTDEPKRRSYAVDDVETISRRMKEIAAERDARVAETELPCDTEPSALCERPGCDGLHAGLRHLTSEETLVNRRATLVKQEDGNWLWVVQTSTAIELSLCPPSIYSDAYWQPLIDAGILSMVDQGDA